MEINNISSNYHNLMNQTTTKSNAHNNTVKIFNLPSPNIKNTLYYNIEKQKKFTHIKHFDETNNIITYSF